MGPGPDSFQTMDYSWISTSAFEIQDVSPLAGGPCVRLFGSSVKKVQKSRPAGWRGYSGQGLLRLHSETSGNVDTTPLASRVVRNQK